MRRRRESGKNLIEKFPHLHEIIGRSIEVVASINGFRGVRGIVIDETRDSLIIKTFPKQKRVEVPKRGNVFSLAVGKVRALLHGFMILGDPVERLKRQPLRFRMEGEYDC